MPIKVREGGAWVEVSSGGSGGSSDPIGTIVAWASSTPPTGWLECNGQSTSGYTELAALIGSNVPDLRGEFVRGWDNGKGTDTGRTLLSTQADEFESHNHTINSYTGGGGPLGGHDGSAYNGSIATSYKGGTETRPRNVALMYIIKHTATSGGSDGTDGVTPLYVSHACIVDRKATGTAGGTSKVSSSPFKDFHWFRNLNHIQFDPDNIVTLAGGTPYGGFTLPNAGSYRIDWSAPFYNVGRFQTALEWVGKGAGFSLPTSSSNPGVGELVEWGTSEFQYNSGNNGQSRSFGSARVTTTESRMYIIRYAVKFATATYGLGVEGDWNGTDLKQPGSTNGGTTSGTDATLYNYYSMVNIYKEG